MSTTSQKTILVPWDFTPVTENALLHAIKIAKKINNQVTLLHIVDKGGLLKNNAKKIKETLAATNKLNELTKGFSDKYKIYINAVVLEGSIFTTIADVASELNVSFVCMGTHGMKGMQKVTGSWAMKVISSTDIPFLVVQEPPSKKEISSIVFPVDENKETAEKLSWGKYLAQNFGAKIHIVKQHYEGGTKVSSNLAFVNKYLTKHETEFDVYEPPKTKKYVDSIISYSNRIEADMIIIMIKRGIHIANYILGTEEQQIIFNEHKIPVMCISQGSKA